MRFRCASKKRHAVAALGFLMGVVTNLCISRAVAGPPFVTDDPQPTDYRNWEIYSGFEYENDRGGGVFAAAPFAEFNYGAMPNIQVSTSLPLDDDYTDTGHRYSYGGTEFGIKARFVQESDNRPQISFYPSVQIPAGCCDRVLTFLPIWLQKSSGPWTAFGGGGLYINTGMGKRDYTFVGSAVERAISPGTTLGIELFHQGPDMIGGIGTTGTNIGVTTQLGAHHALLFSFGRSLSGNTSFSGYASYEFALGPLKR
jgi:hypothetical protein